MTFRRALLLASAAVLAAGCVKGPLAFHCGDTADCAPGYACEEHLCVRPDGGTPVAGSSASAGTSSPASFLASTSSSSVSPSSTSAPSSAEAPSSAPSSLVGPSSSVATSGSSVPSSAGTSFASSLASSASSDTPSSSAATSGVASSSSADSSSSSLSPGTSSSAGVSSSASSGPAPCVLTTLAFLDQAGNQVESVTAVGKYWNFSGADHSSWMSNASLLASVPRYLDGPCSYANGALCDFDTRSLSPATGGGTLETITAYGRIFHFVGGAPAVGNNVLLGSLPRYASGPCAFSPSGTPCTFDARTVWRRADGSEVETVLAYGRRFTFDGVTNPSPGGTLLADLPHLAQGPCLGVAPPCKVDTYEVTTLLGETGRQEVFTAYGKLYIHDVDDQLEGPLRPGYPQDLRSIPRFRDGPCATQ